LVLAKSQRAKTRSARVTPTPQYKRFGIATHSSYTIGSSMTLVQRVVSRHIASENPAAAAGVLSRALEAQKIATEAKVKLESILKILPEDKNVPVMMKTIDKMLKGFEKDIDTSRKTIRDASKASASEILKKNAIAIEKGIKAKLDDPKKLSVIPWSEKDTNGSLVPMVIFRVELGSSRKVEAMLREDPTLRPGVLTWSTTFATWNRRVFTNPIEVVTAFVEQLRGWDGLKGEGELNLKRDEIAKSIIAALNDALRDTGTDPYYVELAKYDVKNLSIEGAYRSDLPKEGESAVGEYEYRRMEAEEIKSFMKILNPALRPFEKDIKKLQVYSGEKSRVYAEIQLY